ncbi:MAG: DUF2508 family protein [Lachnospiraceae bacterium]|nr:DUF2508 family protein [Lachnospiraceae bacterium]
MKIAYCDTKYRFAEAETVNDRGIREEMKKALIALESAYCGFDYATDPDMIDCHIFRINSALKRYRYLLLQADTLHEIPEEGIAPHRAEQPFTTTINVPVTPMVSLYEVTP